MINVFNAKMDIVYIKTRIKILDNIVSKKLMVLIVKKKYSKLFKKKINFL